MSIENLPTRDRILAACLELLENGSTARMSDIAKRAGVSRQAVYLHFTSRAELLIETTFYLDRLHRSDERLAPSRTAATGRARLDAFIAAWAGYLPIVWPLLNALRAMGPGDAEAQAAVAQRMQDLKEGCAAAITALERDGALSPAYAPQHATDLLWAALQPEIWHRLVADCGWTQDQYAALIAQSARHLFVQTD